MVICFYFFSRYWGRRSGLEAGGDGSKLVMALLFFSVLRRFFPSLDLAAFLFLYGVVALWWVHSVKDVFVLYEVWRNNAMTFGS